MPTIAEQLTEEQRAILVGGDSPAAVKSVEEARDLSIQARVTATATSMPGVWWFTQPIGEWEISPWWSPQRDVELREFVKKPGNDILAGAVASMVKKFKAMNWTLDGPKTTVQDRQEVLSEAEFGRGWSTLISKTVEDYLTVDRGCFWELIGKGKVDGPLQGLPIGVAHLDACRCHLTGDPEFPVVFLNSKDGRARKLHATRVVHLVDMESPNEAMAGIGFSSVSRVIASSQILYMLSRFKREKLDDLPQAGLLVLNNVVPQRWEDAKAEYERGRRQLGQEIWANIMTLIGVDPAQPADAKFVSFSQIPDAFNEKESVETYVNIVALSLGIDIREIWPSTAGAALGTATESEVMHRKAAGKGIGDLISTIERAVNWRLLPKRVEFHFDNIDSEEDQIRGQLEDQKTKTIVSMYIASDANGESLATRDETRQMLADNVDYFDPTFLDVDLTGDQEVSDIDRESQKAWGPVVVMDQDGKVIKTVRKGYKGGPGSGNYGHAGRPGLVGGSGGGSNLGIARAQELERSIRRQAKEIAFVIDSSGNVVVSSVGDESSVGFTADEDRVMMSTPGAILTHNHPRGSSGLSFSDLKIAAQGHVEEVRAIHKPSGKVYIMRTTQARFGKYGDRNWPVVTDLKEAYLVHHYAVGAMHGPLIASKKMTLRAANAAHGAEVCRRVAEQFGLEFLVEKS